MFGNLLDFLGNQPFLLLYAAAVAVSLLRYRRYFETPLRYFSVLLMYNLLTELMGARMLNDDGWSLILNDFYFNNRWLVYNSYALIYILYLLYIFYAYLENPRLRKAARLSMGLYVLASFGNALFTDFKTQTQLYAYTLGGVLIIGFSAFYLRQEFRKKEMRGLRRRNLLMWISLGNLVFFTGYIPLKIMRSQLEFDQSAGIEGIRYAHLVLIYFMYACLLAGFLLMRRMKKPR